MKKVFFFFFCMLFFLSPWTDISAFSSEIASPEAKTWSLEALYKRALNQSEQIRIVEEQLFIAHKDKAMAIAALIPDLAAFGQYTYNDELTTQNPDSSQAYGAQLSHSFTLNGKELLGFRIAKDNIAMAEYDLSAAKEGYLFMVAAGYYQVLKLSETKETALANVKRLEAHRDAVLLQLRLEEIPKTELYRTEAELSGSKTGLVQAENSLLSARINLATLVDLPEDFRLGLPDFTQDLPFETDNLEQTAFSSRADLKALEIGHKNALAMVKYTRGSFWPVISLEGTYTKMDADPSSFMPMNPLTGLVDEDIFSAGVNVSFLLFEGGLRRAALSQAKAREKQAGFQVEAYEKQVSLEVRQAYLDMMTAKSAISSLKDQLTAAKKNYEAVSQHFKTGLANSLNVMDANTLLTKSERELAEARYNYELAILNLKMAGGLFLKSIKAGIED